MVVSPDIQVELSEQQWRGMAYGALYREFSTLVGVVNELGGVLERRFGGNGMMEMKFRRARTWDRSW